MTLLQKNVPVVGLTRITVREALQPHLPRSGSTGTGRGTPSPQELITWPRVSVPMTTLTRYWFPR